MIRDKKQCINSTKHKEEILVYNELKIQVLSAVFIVIITLLIDYNDIICCRLLYCIGVIIRLVNRRYKIVSLSVSVELSKPSNFVIIAMKSPKVTLSSPVDSRAHNALWSQTLDIEWVQYEKKLNKEFECVLHMWCRMPKSNYIWSIAVYY